jgi:Leucine-rich repeat (LRR) protein
MNFFRLIPALALFNLPWLVQSCGIFSQSSTTKSLGYQTTVEGKSIIVTLDSPLVGDSLLKKEIIEPANRPVFTDVTSDTTANPRGHFPDYVIGWGINPTLSFQVKICDAFQTATDPVNCLNDVMLENYFGNSDKADVTRAIADALQLLTYSDRVPSCYVEALKQTENFEKSITEIDVSRSRDRLTTALKSAIFSECKNVNRAEWGNHPTCRNPNLNGILQNLKRAINSAVTNNGSIRTAYEHRNKLAMRLGVDEFADFNDITDLYEINPYPSSIADYRQNFGCSTDSAIGDDACLFGKKIVSNLVADGDATKHIFVTVDKELEGLLENQKFEADKRYAELFWMAVRLAKATNLSPREVIANLETNNPTLKASCEDVAAYKLGDQSKRAMYVLEPYRFENPGSPAFAANPVDEIFINQGRTVTKLPAQGSKFSLWMDSGEDCNALDGKGCSLEASQVGTDFSHGRIRFFRPFSSPEEKIFPARSINNGRVLLLDRAEIKELKSAVYNNAAIYLDLCRKNTDCQNPLEHNWINIGSWRFENAFVKECFKGSQSSSWSFFAALFKNRNIPNNDCAELFNNVINVKELDLSNANIESVVPIQYLVNLQKLDVRGNQIRDVRALEYLADLEQANLIDNPLDVCPIASSNKTLSAACLDSMPFVRLCKGDIFVFDAYEIMDRLNEIAHGASCEEKFLSLSELTSLDLSNPNYRFMNIYGVEPLRGLTNLTRLDLSSNLISDLEPLRGLVNLRYLDLTENARALDIEPVQSLTNLEFLDLKDNYYIESIEPLRNLKNLTSLTLHFSYYRWSLEPLRSLINLTTLRLVGDGLDSLEPLRDLVNLTSLDLLYSSDLNLEPLRSLRNLTSLSLEGNDGSNLEPLSRLSKLKRLDLSRSKVKSLEPLRYLTDLEVVILTENQVSSLEPLRNRTNLTHLNLSHNQISSIEPLRGLKNLTNLDVSYNQIRDSEPLRGLTGLTSLVLSNNHIVSLESLRLLTHLTRFDLSHNQITSVEPLRDYTSLVEVNLSYNQIGSLAPLRHSKAEYFEATTNPIERTAQACPTDSKSEAINRFCVRYLR